MLHVVHKCFTASLGSKSFDALKHKQKMFALLLPLFFILNTRAQSSEDAKFPAERTPTDVVVNYKVPDEVLPEGAAISVSFSKEPTDEEIFRVHFFEEPLVPMKGSFSAKENTDLVYALAAFSQRKSADDFSSVTNFLIRYPKSRWQGALLANLGILYRKTGYYNQAMDAWEKAWELLKAQKEPKAKILADKMIAELLMINSWLGRMKAMETLLKGLDKRVIEGPAMNRIVVVREALAGMKNQPELTFKCGPYALNQILINRSDTVHGLNEKLRQVRSTPKGFSLTEVKAMAADVGLRYQMAFRKPGAEVILNSVVHWKLDHYSALLKKEGGYYGCEDATMGMVNGQRFWLTAAALDSSASGYFLVPEGPLPAGWRKVDEGEGSKVFGKGNQKPPDKPLSKDDKKCPDCPPVPGMASCNVHAAAVSLHIADRPLFYTPPVGPAIMWDVHYLQRDNYQPANFNYSNFGQQWTFEWLSYIQDDPVNLSANIDVYLMGGGVRTFTGFSSTDTTSEPELQTNDVLVRVCPNCYELRHPDGSKEEYARPDGSTVAGRRIFLTKKIDAAGNAVTVGYDANLRILSLKDAIGQVTTLYYENTNDIYKITKVRAPYGRYAYFTYDGAGRLASIKDVIGLVSSFQYDAGNFITQMSTPYGITRFTTGAGADGYSRFVETTYPLGEKERVEYRENAPGIAMYDPVAPQGMVNSYNYYLVYRNTFFWDKKAMKEAPGDYTKAKIYHWLHGSATDAPGSASSVLESVKEPLENRVWFDYQGQGNSIVANQGMSSQPADVGRVLDDGTTQLYKFAYNPLGYDTLSIDPIGRTIRKKYDANNIDLLEVRNVTKGANDTLARFTYNKQHLPLTATDASGLRTDFAYNTKGQLTSVTNPRKEKTSFGYDSKGFLKTITGPVAGDTVKFTYDLFGRVRTVTDPEGYTVTTDYDNLDRPTLITYPDQTFEQVVYSKLDAVHMRDRMGRWSHAIYDSLDRLNATVDALGRVNQFMWCSCGSLAEIVDPLKHVTQFTRDLQGRLISKIYDDNKTITYKYDSTTSRLQQVTDAKGQVTRYSYAVDDNLKRIDYLNSTTFTPSAIFNYDSSYNRLDSMRDWAGRTIYSYYPVVANNLGAGRLKSIDGPLYQDVISYTYDSLGRVASRAINGVASSVAYDALGRVTSATNALGAFGYNYVRQTGRLSGMSYPNGQSTAFDYYDNVGDQRLKQIRNIKGSTTLSQFDYEYNPEGQITKWTQQAGAGTPTAYSLSYDMADQLIAATLKSQNAIVKRYAYQYDKAGNRTSEQVDGSVASSTYNTLNQLTAQQSGGAMYFQGTVSKFASLVVKNTTTQDSAKATVDSATNGFEAFVKVAPGPNNIAIRAVDYSGNGNDTTQTYNINVGNGGSNTLAYDDNGNTLTATNPAVTYVWDGADRLLRIKNGTDSTEFVYDALNRRVGEKLNGSYIRRWVWDGTELVEERSGTGNTVTKRFFPQGEVIGSKKYYFTRDHLGSVREMTDASGNLIARYDYDPYGRRKLVAGVDTADFGFTGHYVHKRSGLHLALYRAYDANAGRWLNRDPINEAGGMNLYNYVDNSPLAYTDPKGLAKYTLPPLDGSVKLPSPLQGPFTPGLSAAGKTLNAAGKVGGVAAEAVHLYHAREKLKCKFEEAQKNLEDQLDLANKIKDPLERQAAIDNAMEIYYYDVAIASTEYLTETLEFSVGIDLGDKILHWISH